MRILHVVNVYSEDGSVSEEPFVKIQIDSLLKKGVKVDVLNIKGHESKVNYGKCIYKCRMMLEQNGYNIVHGHYVYSGWIAALQKRIPSIISFMGSDLYGAFDQSGKLTSRGRLDIRLSKYLQYLVDGIIVKSEEMMDLLIAPQKAIVLPNGVDFDQFRDFPMLDARKALGLHPQKLFVLFAGNHHLARKCFHIAKESVDLLRSIDSRYEIILANRVPHKEIPIYMNAANVLVLPSMKEGSPNVVKEALACNLPVVATDVGDVKELIGNIPGCKVVERTPDAFARAIQEVLCRKEAFKGREAVSHLKADIIASKLISFYEMISLNHKEKRHIKMASFSS